MSQPDHRPAVQLDRYRNAWFSRGRARAVEAAWIVVQALFVSSWLPGATHRVALLRFFGARIGRGVDLKPGLKVKFPWRLRVGNHTWIGEDVWIDNLAQVCIGSNCCVSQGAYLCTGSHDWKSPSFDLIVKPITIQDSGWVAARASLTPGTVMGEGSVLSLGSVGTGILEPWSVYSGIPAIKTRARELRHPNGLL